MPVLLPELLAGGAATSIDTPIRCKKECTVAASTDLEHAIPVDQSTTQGRKPPGYAHEDVCHNVNPHGKSDD
jgi:hypothetical protein